MPLLKKALIQWELGRLPFNLILFLLGLLWSWPLRETMIDEALLGYWGSIAAFGFTANVFYTLGPAAETYWLIFRGGGFGSWRWPLWGLGLLISLGLTYTFVWTMDILYVHLFPSRGGVPVSP